MTKRSTRLTLSTALLAIALSIPAGAMPAQRGREPEGPITRIVRTIHHFIVAILDDSEMSIPH